MEESVFKSFFESSSEGLAVVSQSGVIEVCNKAFRRIFGYNEGELVGRGVDILIPSAVRGKHAEYRREYSEKPEHRSMGNNRELNGQKKDGQLVPVEVSLSPVKLNEETKVAVLVSDITERLENKKQIEELNASLQEKVAERTAELQKAQELFELIARNYPNGTINVFDRELNYVFVDGQELSNQGINKKLLLGTSFLDRIAKDVRLEVQNHLERTFSGRHELFEVRLNYQVYELISVPLFDENNEVDQILVVERNVTDERRAQEEIENALSKERELNDLKSRFVAMASHEFRTPLTSIKSSADLIGRYVESSQQDKREKHIDRIKSNVAHLTNILNDILSLSKLEEGKITTEVKTISLPKYMSELMEEMSSYAQGNVDLSWKHEGEEAIQFDGKLLKNILVNLISNAIKYSPEGESILVKSKASDKLEISVIDHGIGIPEKDQSGLFDRFYRASNVTNIEGTGLGLNIVKRFVELLEGEISFTSEPHVRTIFTVKFNLK